MVCLIFTAEDPFAAGGGKRVVLGFEGLVVGGDPLSSITPALIRGSDRSVGWMTANPWAAQKSASGPYPLREARKFVAPCPWESRMMGGSSPLAGTATFSSRSTGRPGTFRTTAL